MKQKTNSLQLVVNNRQIAKPYVPLAPVREQIFRTYMEGREAIEVAAVLKVPVAQVRTVLRGYQEIHRRLSVAAGREFPRWQRATEAEIAAEVWREIAQRPGPVPGASALRRAS